jgi:hypothetical protein
MGAGVVPTVGYVAGMTDAVVVTGVVGVGVVETVVGAEIGVTTGVVVVPLLLNKGVAPAPVVVADPVAVPLTVTVA